MGPSWAPSKVGGEGIGTTLSPRGGMCGGDGALWTSLGPVSGA